MAKYQFRQTRRMLASVVATGLSVAASHAQLDENFNTVTETGGATILDGSGFNFIMNWDDGILGEGAFAGTEGPIQIVADAMGDSNAGVSGSGAGVLSVGGFSFNLLNVTFNNATGMGGGAFLVGDGNPNTFNFTTDWDSGLTGEGAFGGTANGAVLVGNMSAQGLPTGGNDGSGAGQLDVTNVMLNGGVWFAGLQWDIGALPGAPILQNPGFDQGGLAGWSIYSAGFNVLAETSQSNSAPGSCKMFGRFTNSANESGIFQSLPAQPGQVWEIDCASLHVTGDSLIGSTNFTLMRIEYRDAGGVVLLSQDQTVLDTNSPTDIWIDNAPMQLLAPTGTVEVRPVFAFSQPSGTQGGAGYFDDCRLRLVSGPSAVDLSQFALVADVRGIANAAGETLGTIQLRIEDADGDRLRFTAPASGNWQTLGGALNTAQEADVNGNPASGVFDINSSSYRVVVAFDNDSTAWGTGGTLNVDNLQVTNSMGGGGAWFAGFAWEGLAVPASALLGTLGLDEIELSADIFGSQNGGAYELRVEAFNEFEAGLDEDFNGVTGTGGGLFFDQASIMGGATQNFIPTFDDGAIGGAFGGIFGNAEFFSGGGISAQGVTSGGPDGSGFGEVRVENVIFGPGGGWFAGLTWPNQGLASTDLSQVVLSADIRGLANGGFLGPYELRIEDQQGDRLYFQATANGNWQSIGGTLDTATEAGAAGGGGDGTFNLDSPSYAVTVSFVDAQLTWEFGGTLQIDNLFLTPVTVRNEVGRRSFSGIANGSSFQNVGGLLSDAIGSLGDFMQDFSSATGTGGNAGTGGGWDDGIEMENAFFGTFGNAAVNGSTMAEACLTCGVAGTPAARITINNVTPGTGGWFTGMFFTPISTSLADGLAGVTLSADIKGEANGAGSMLGEYFLRLEDDNGDFLTFNTVANGSFQSVGGPLNTATPDQSPDGSDGIFNLNLSTYTITLGAVGTSTNWGAGMTLTIDNLFLNGVALSSVDSFTVVVSYADEAATWPNGGDLIVDNVYFGPASGGLVGDMNCDGAVTVSDIGGFVLALTNPAQYMAQFPNCDINNADVNDDNAITVSDIGPFVSLLTGG
ncbi:MAG: hypothetical protein AB7N71_03285 [Phycisphaerae bacterium]